MQRTPDPLVLPPGTDVRNLVPLRFCDSEGLPLLDSQRIVSSQRSADRSSRTVLESRAESLSEAARSLSAWAVEAEKGTLAAADKVVSAIRSTCSHHLGIIRLQEAEIWAQVHELRASSYDPIATQPQLPRAGDAVACNTPWSHSVRTPTSSDVILCGKPASEALGASTGIVIPAQGSAFETPPRPAHRPIIIPGTHAAATFPAGAALSPPLSRTPQARGSPRTPSPMRRSRLAARLRITSADLELQVPAPGHLLVPGLTAEFRVIIKPEAIGRGGGLGSPSLDASLALLARGAATFVSAAAPPGSPALAEPLHIPVSVAYDPASGALLFRFVVPRTLRGGGSVVIHGAVVDSSTVWGLPVSLSTARPVRAPRELDARPALCLAADASAGRGSWSQLCVSADGVVFVPAGGAVVSFEADGARRPDISLIPLVGPSAAQCCVFDDETGTLFVVGAAFGKRPSAAAVTGINVASRTVRWCTTFGETIRVDSSTCTASIALVSQRGVVVASDTRGLTAVIRTSDGILVGSLVGRHCALAADPVSGLVLSCDAARAFRVTAHSWTGAFSTEPAAVFAAAGTTARPRPLTVVPPPQGCQQSYIVASIVGTPSLQVLALPTLALVHTHELACAGIVVCGLAADRTGTALLVADAASGYVIALPWPLPGMPSLE